MARNTIKTRPALKNTSEILDYIEANTVKYLFKGHEQEFLPRRDVDFVAAEETIRAVISKDNETWLSQKDKELFVKDTIQHGRKMFVTCVYGELPMSCLHALLKDGLTDKRFPFKLEDCAGQKDKRKFQKRFIVNQKLFKAAYFDLNSVLRLDGDIAKPIECDESDEALLGEGAFGQVFRIKIHKDHRSFSSGADRQDQFAMKVTAHKANREVSFHKAMADLSHHHLLKCLASFIFSSKYHMIYEKADCDVENFMANHPKPWKLSNLAVNDLAQQLFGLADALLCIHEQGRSDSSPKTSFLGVPGRTSEKTGYIHDIKPENLLMFIYVQGGKKTYWFRLSDFSCAKVVDLVASVSGHHRHSWRSVSKSGTPVYRPPETSDTGQSSRPYDLWSLGCVYLELLVWFLDGYDALLKFRGSRQGLVKPNGVEDQGFYYTKDTGKKARYEVRPTVMAKVKDVAERCHGPLKDIAKAIPKLLQVIPENRMTAGALVKTLKHIDTGAKPPVVVGPFQQGIERDRPLSSLTPHSSDSESGFNVTINIRQPTDE